MSLRVRLVVLAVPLALAVTAAPARSGSVAGPLPTAVKATCPGSSPEALAGDALAGATSAALKQAPLIYRSTNLDGMRATQAVLATFDVDRGGYAAKCGSAVHRRTVVVYLQFPAMRPSASLSQGVLLLSRFAGQFRVWAVLH